MDKKYVICQRLRLNTVIKIVVHIFFFKFMSVENLEHDYQYIEEYNKFCYRVKSDFLCFFNFLTFFFVWERRYKDIIFLI